MNPLRILAFGDNHGDMESLSRIVEETAGEEFDYIIHTGDITNTYKTNLQTGVEQLKKVEPYFEKLSQRAELVYIYGNRDRERSPVSTPRHVTEGYELSSGHRLRQGETIEVAGQRFTSNPQLVTKDDIFVTHGFRSQQFYQTESKAYFCGDTHRAVQQNNALNTGYLFNDKGYIGAYFTTELVDTELSTRVHGINERWRAVECPNHQWYGTQFHPVKFGCRICEFGPQRQFSPMARIAFNSVTDGAENEETATVEEIVSSARKLFVDTEEYGEQIRRYLLDLAVNPAPSLYDPLVPAPGDQKRLQSPNI